MAFNLDDMTRDGVIQYNYTHDNYGGGYMLHVRQNHIIAIIQFVIIYQSMTVEHF